MTVERVLLAAPRGFCAGVEMAIKALAHVVDLFGPPVYCFHRIVHNEVVVRRFEEAGVVFVDDIEHIPPGYPVLLSAHGSAPEVVAAARARSTVTVDAVCPLVTKVHHELKSRAARDYTVLYAGHEGHDEAVGTMAVAPDAVHLVESPAAVRALEGIAAPVAFLAQTTLSHDEWSEILDTAAATFGDVWLPAREDLCYATTNRQAAVRAIAPRCDAVIVVGSRDSSNTQALVRVARQAGAPLALRVDGAQELPDGLAGVIGVTSGASVPEPLVDEVVATLAPTHGVEHADVVREDAYFPPPADLRPLLSAGDISSDRSVSASDVLDRLPRDTTAIT